MTETVILDPIAIDSARYELAITSWIDVDGPDWGDAEIQAYMSDQQVGSSPIDYRIPNRTIKIPLNLRAVGAVPFATIRSRLQQKTALFQQGGGTIMRQVDSTALYADVVNAKLHLGGSWLQAFRSADIDAVLELECIPDWYGAEVSLSSHAVTTLPELVFTEPTVTGNYPGRVRIVVTNDSAADWHGLLWGVRCRNYSPVAGAALAYEAEALTLLDAGTRVARAGASGGTVVRHPGLPANAWCPVLMAEDLTHIGSYRVWARCYAASATPRLRLAWDVGDLTGPAINDPVRLPAAGAFYDLDLGQVNITPSPVGSHRWQPVIQAEASNQDDQLEIDRIYFQPLDESAGRLTNVAAESPFVISNSAYAGTATNNAGIGTKPWQYLERATGVEDGTGAAAGVIDGEGTQESNYLLLTDFGFEIPPSATITGIKVDIRRRNDSHQYHVADITASLIKNGAITGLNYADIATVWGPKDTYEWKTYGGETDLWGATWTPTDINSSTFGFAFTVILLTTWGLDLPNNADVDAAKITVYFRLGTGFSTHADAVVYAGRIAELRTDGMYRAGTAGYYGPVSQILGDLPRLPASGLEARPVQVFLKPSRGNFDNEADSGIDAISARIYYRPSFLYTA